MGAGFKRDRAALRATRHTCGTMLYRATKDLRLVQKHLGHARPTTTAIYADVLEEEDEEDDDAKPAGYMLQVVVARLAHRL